jgi:hypothetical protein
VTPRLQFLTLDASPLSHPEQARAALRAGVRRIQVRAKGRAEDEWVALARAVVALAASTAPSASSMTRRAWPGSPAPTASTSAPRMRRPPRRVRELGDAAIVGATLNFPRASPCSARPASTRGRRSVPPDDEQAKLARAHSADSSRLRSPEPPRGRPSPSAA